MSQFKQTIKNIPVLGSIARKLNRMIKGAPAFNQADALAELTIQVRFTRANVQHLALALAQLEQTRLGQGAPVARLDSIAGLRSLGTSSTICTQEQFTTPEYLYWCERIKESPVWHRKQWEYYIICQALWERDMLRQGRSGCVFGVGKEPLPALFASLGCRIVATDAPPSDAIEQQWNKTGQFASSLSDLNERGIAPAELFAAHVTFRPADMHHIPGDLAGFDFVWSSCAMEHLGSIEKGIEFIVNACRCLRPGGVAVHTTEFNCSSDDKTIDSGPLVLFRRKDIAEMGRRLGQAGARLAPPRLEPGTGLLDGFTAIPPYDFTKQDMPMLRLVVGEYVSTSLALIVEKSAGAA